MSNGQMPIGERQDLVNDVKNLWRKHQAALLIKKKEEERRLLAEQPPPPPSKPPVGSNPNSRRSFLERIKASSRTPSATTPASSSSATATNRDLEDLQSEAEVKELSYQNLKAILVKRNISTRRLLRKQDLQKEVIAVWKNRAVSASGADLMVKRQLSYMSDDSGGDVLLLDEINTEEELERLSDVNLKIILKIYSQGQRPLSSALEERDDVLQTVKTMWRNQNKVPTLDDIASLDDVSRLEVDQLKSILKKDFHACKDKEGLLIRVQFLWKLREHQGFVKSPKSAEAGSDRPSFPPPPPPGSPVLGIAAETEIPYLSEAQMKGILQENGVSVQDMTEKGQLIDSLTQLYRDMKQRKSEAAIITPPAGTVMV